MIKRRSSSNAREFFKAQRAVLVKAVELEVPFHDIGRVTVGDDETTGNSVARAGAGSIVTGLELEELSSHREAASGSLAEVGV